MKNFALRIALLPLYVLAAVWLICFFIPVLLFMVGYWLVTGKWEF